MFLESATLFVLLIGTFYIYSKYKLSYWTRRGVPSIQTHCIFGNFKDTFTFKKPPGQVIQEIYEKSAEWGPCVGFYVFHQPKLLIRDLNLIKQLMVKDFDVFPNRCFGGDLQIDSVGLVNLLGIHQPRWKYLRQKLTPSVTGLKLRGMIPLLIQNCGDPMLEFVRNSKSRQDGWKVLELKDISSKYTTDVIASLAFGIDTNSFDENKLAFWEAGQKILSGAKRGIILIILFFLPGLIKFIKPFMVEPAKYFRYVFWDSVNSREKNSIKRNDLVDHFISLKKGEQRTDFKFEGDNLSQAVSFYVAGFEASSTAIAFTLYELSRHPEDEKRLYNEIKENLSDGKELTSDSINEMPFLDQVVNESLRMYPPLPIVDRVAVRDYKLPGTSWVIEKGTPVYVSVNGTNRDPKYFDKPNEFIPTRPRWEAEDLPSSSLSFGVGPRSCVGMRLGLLITKIALITLLSEYTLSNVKNDETLLKPITVFTAAADGIHVKLRKRE